MTAANSQARSKPRLRLSELTPARLSLHGTYDAAQTNDDNRKHWAAADFLSANAAHDPMVRAILRARARYKFANNSYCRGMLLTLANDVIGTGPRLQILGLDTEQANVIERRFNRWPRTISIGVKLRCARMARGRDGESFVLRVTNRGLADPVKLDVRLIECDQVTTPDLNLLRRDEQLTDGIVFDPEGNPQFYHVLKQHPGETTSLGGFMRGGALAAYDTIAAANIRHLFRLERPGQTRGVSEIAPALPLYAQLRRYTLAVIAAAEAAADVAGVIKSTFTPQEGAAVEAFDAVEFERRLWMTMPEGWDISQLKAEQPATTYEMFKREIVNEIARCLNMPYNVAAANSASYNYASGRLDHQVYWRSNDVERDEIELVIMDWLLDSWLAEATRIDGYLPPLPAGAAAVEELEHEWHWDGVEHVDPLKEANAEDVRISNNSLTLAESYAKRGKDWERELRQRARERELERELNIAPAPPQGSALARTASAPAPGGDGGDGPGDGTAGGDE